MDEKNWLLGLHGHEEPVALEEVVRLIRGGQLRETDMVKRAGEPWRSVADVPELATHLHPRAPVRSRKTGRFREPAKRQAPRPVPKPGPLEALGSRYFSPTDLLRAMTYALAPRKLLAAAAVLVPASVAYTVLRDLGTARATSVFGARAIEGAAGSILLFAAGIATMLLAFMTRRQVEGIRLSSREAAGYVGRNCGAAFLVPLHGVILAGVVLSLIGVLGWARTSGAGMAETMRWLYGVPFALGLIAVLVGVFLEIALMTGIPAMTVEGCGLREAMRLTVYYVRTQPGRLLLHWLLVTLVAVLAYRFSAWLVGLGYSLPQWIAGADWTGGGLAGALHAGLRDGLALVAPASLFATMGTLSYLILRQEDMVYATEEEGNLEDTSVSKDGGS